MSLIIAVSGVISLTAVFLFSPSAASAGTVQLPRTGQSLCYDYSGAPITFAGTGQDAALKMGVSWPQPRFVVGTGAEEDCVTDSLTGLMWVKSPDSSQIAWVDALAIAKGLFLCGHSDWRLPNVNELESLTHAGYFEESCGGAPCACNAAWLVSQGFSGMSPSGYWTSTTDAHDENRAWDIQPCHGYMYNDDKTLLRTAWPVRGGGTDGTIQLPATGQKTCYNQSGSTPCSGTGQDGEQQKGVAWPTPRFHDNTDGTIMDNLTGLIWLRDANCIDTVAGITKTNGILPWNDALSWSNSLAIGKCNLTDGSKAGDWRLPNRKELMSLTNYGFNEQLCDGVPCATNAAWLITQGFINLQTLYEDYWSSTSSTNDMYGTNQAWYVHMYDGSEVYDTKPHYERVWPVRGGLTSFFNVAVSMTGSGSGTVVSWPAGINCSSTCFAPFIANSIVRLTAIPDIGGSIFSGWTGNPDCSDGVITVIADTSCIATFDLCPTQPVEVGVTTYDSIEAAYSVASSANVIKLIAYKRAETIDFSLNKNVTLQGGYDCTFASVTSDSTTTIAGAITISNGTITINNIVIQ